MLIFLSLCTFLLLPTYCDIQFDSINYSTIDPSYIINSSSTSGDNLTYFSIPADANLHIQVDLRHLQDEQILHHTAFLIQINNVDSNQSYSQTLPLTISSNTYQFYAANNLVISLSFRITALTPSIANSFQYLLRNTTSVIVHLAAHSNNISQISSQSSFVFIVSSSDQINLPYNAVKQSDPTAFQGYFYSKKQNKDELKQYRINSSISNNDYWGSINSFAVPYLPYFSNCENSGDYMFFSQLIHNQSQCQLAGSSLTPINQFAFGSAPIADSCTIKRTCLYDQNASLTQERPYWNTLMTDNYLFYVSVNQISPTDYSLGMDFATTDLVQCKIMHSEGTNQTGTAPLKVNLYFGYYQINQTTRKMVTCSVNFTLYTDATSPYALQIAFQPLNHTEVLLAFKFNWYVYLIVFVVIGFIASMQFLIFWLYHFIFKLQYRAPKLVIYLQIFKQVLHGVFLAIIILFFINFAVEFMMNGTLFGQTIFTTAQTSLWDFLPINNIGYFGENVLVSNRTGRMGFAFMICGVFLILELGQFLIGKEMPSKEYEDYEILGRKISPRSWTKAKLLLGTVFMINFSIFLIYFAYSNTYSNNIWLFIAVTKIMQMILEEISFSIFDDSLPCLPFKLLVSIVAYLNTLSANTLYDFMLSYLVDVATSMVEITYLSQIQNGVAEYVEEKSMQLSKFYSNLINDDDEDVADLSDNNEDEKDSEDGHQLPFLHEVLAEVELITRNKVEEYIADEDLAEKDYTPTQIQSNLKQQYVQFLEKKRESLLLNLKGESSKIKAKHSKQHQQEEEEELQKSFEIILEGSLSMLQYLLQPIIILVFWSTYQQNNVLVNYNITLQTINLYFLSAIIIGLFSLINIFITFQCVQCYLNLNLQETIQKLFHKFQNRVFFWICDDNACINPQLRIKLKGSEHFCISSQFFFILTMYVGAIFLIIIGISTIIAAQYNIFRDIVLLLIALFWFILFQILKLLVKKVVEIFNIWNYKDYLASTEENTFLAEKSSNLNAIKDINSNKYQNALSQQQTQQVLIKDDLIQLQSQFKFTMKKTLSEENIISEKEKPSQYLSSEQKDDEEQKSLLIHRKFIGQRQDFSIVQAKLIQICKKLEPQFSDEAFRISFCLENKEFIKQNLQRILPLIKQFPENEEFFQYAKEKKQKEEAERKERKNCDPFVTDILMKWMKTTIEARKSNIQNGIESQRKIKKCNFCFQTSNLYFGYQGICLDCSKKLLTDKKTPNEEHS